MKRGTWLIRFALFNYAVMLVVLIRAIMAGVSPSVFGLALAGGFVAVALAHAAAGLSGEDRALHWGAKALSPHDNFEQALRSCNVALLMIAIAALGWYLGVR